ncbi:transketolase C-terminal domain-containing protein [Oricola nitratireducens]|uniref:transketolase C-terminal domain-containing protein n=1 Tax=Oricola nitratireducens TaxID=2775868 RepID=UPI0018696516|nr:transketolase C-terminal domain-containing protein [Oricola nitratireducens]
MQNLSIVPKTEIDRISEIPLPDDAKLALIADLCRLNALTAIKKAGSGHIGSSFSAMDIVVHLYLRAMNTLAVGFDSPDRDIYFSSKGHDAPGLYAALYGFGALAEDKLLMLRRIGGPDGHPDIAVRGIEANSGSLGMGIGKARGMALAKRLQGHGGHVYVLLGDGELQEGQIWESLLTAANQGMAGVTVIVDRNGYQSDKHTEVISPLGNLRQKFEAFGCSCLEIDGHDHVQIAGALCAPSENGKPKIIVANTVKGRGVSFMEGPADVSSDYIYRYHSGAPSDENYERATAELLARVNAVMAASGADEIGTRSVQRIPASAAPSDENVASAYGDCLVELGREHPELCVLVADLADDCKTRGFAAEFPDRFVENGIAEQDMCSVAGGMARSGLLPVVNSFGCFLASRANEQIFNNFTEETRIIHAFHLAGLVPAGPGKSHQSLRDISLMAALPGMEIIQPCGAEETRQALRYCVRDSRSSCVLRMNIGPSPRRIPLPDDYRLARGQGTVLTEGEDALLFAYGPIMLDQALSAAGILRERGIGLTVVNMPWLNIADDDWLSALVARHTTILTIDDHCDVGGLGDFLLARLARLGQLSGRIFAKAGVAEIPACGTADEVLRHHRLDAESLASRVQDAMR